MKVMHIYPFSLQIQDKLVLIEIIFCTLSLDSSLLLIFSNSALLPHVSHTNIYVWFTSLLQAGVGGWQKEQSEESGQQSRRHLLCFSLVWCWADMVSARKSRPNETSERVQRASNWRTYFKAVNWWKFLCARQATVAYLCLCNLSRS